MSDIKPAEKIINYNASPYSYKNEEFQAIKNQNIILKTNITDIYCEDMFLKYKIEITADNLQRFECDYTIEYVEKEKETEIFLVAHIPSHYDNADIAISQIRVNEKNSILGIYYLFAIKISFKEEI